MVLIVKGVLILISVRKAIAKDIDNIIEFLSAIGFSRKDIYTDKDYFVYYDNNLLLGCGIAFSEDEYCIIDNIIVDEKYRRNKIGTAIAKTIMNYFELKGAKIALCCLQCDSFCKALGFSLTCCDDIPCRVKSLLNKNVQNIYTVSLEGYFKDYC